LPRCFVGNGVQEARFALGSLLTQLRVAPVAESTVRLALASAMHDFEDAICHAAAREVGASAIVTRNVDDYAGSIVPAVLPGIFVAEASRVAFPSQALTARPPGTG
jgi:hypothetical protein